MNESMDVEKSEPEYPEKPAIEQPKQEPQKTVTYVISQQPMRNPGIATVLSFFWTGLGQIYNGQIAKGLLLMFLQGVNVLLMIVVIGFLTFPLFWIYGMYDAHETAKLMNEKAQSQIIK